MEELGAVARRLCHPRRPGSLRFLQSLMIRGDRPAAESHPEVVLGDALRTRGIPVVPQVTGLQLPNGTNIRIDLAVPHLRWAIEIDVHRILPSRERPETNNVIASATLIGRSSGH